MKITLLVVGKTSSVEIKNLCADYAIRINHYTKFGEITVDDSSVKVRDRNSVKEKEGELLLRKISASDFVILMDERGKEFTSLQFAGYLENIFNRSLKNICFIIGGAYGFDRKMHERANAKISLSKLTFSHQMVRVVFMEQLYRAFSIMRKEPYHHE